MYMYIYVCIYTCIWRWGVGNSQTQAVCLYHLTCSYTLHARFNHGGRKILEQFLELSFVYLSLSLSVSLSIYLYTYLYHLTCQYKLRACFNHGIILSVHLSVQLRACFNHGIILSVHLFDYLYTYLSSKIFLYK